MEQIIGIILLIIFGVAMIVCLRQWILSVVRRSFLRKKLADERLDWQDFYEIMQTYRHAPMTEQHKVIDAFEDVKKWIRQNYA